MKNIILASLLCLCSIKAQAKPNHNNDKNIAAANKMLSSHASLMFIENKGQISEKCPEGMPSAKN